MVTKKVPARASRKKPSKSLRDSKKLTQHVDPAGLFPPKTWSELSGLLGYLSGCSDISEINFDLSRKSKVSNLQRQFRELLEEWVGTQAEILVAGWVHYVRTHGTPPQELQASSPATLPVSGKPDPLQPWFDSRKESVALRGKQTIRERKLWATYFKRFGCLCCHKKDGQHGALGMCTSCRGTIYARRRRILSEPLPGEAE